MRGKRKGGERLLESALEALVQALKEAGAPWMIIGGIAIIARGVRRFTTDIDVAVRGDAISVPKLAEILAAHDIVGRIPDAIPFAQANMVLLVRHSTTGVDLDVTLAWSEFEHEALDAAQEAKFGRVKVAMTMPDDLVVFKAIAASDAPALDSQLLPSSPTRPKCSSRSTPSLLGRANRWVRGPRDLRGLWCRTS